MLKWTFVKYHLHFKKLEAELQSSSSNNLEECKPATFGVAATPSTDLATAHSVAWCPSELDRAGAKTVPPLTAAQEYFATDNHFGNHSLDRTDTDLHPHSAPVTKRSPKTSAGNITRDDKVTTLHYLCSMITREKLHNWGMSPSSFQNGQFTSHQLTGIHTKTPSTHNFGRSNIITITIIAVLPFNFTNNTEPTPKINL